MNIDYLSLAAIDDVSVLFNKDADVSIEVNDRKIVKWLLWYLPYVEGVRCEPPPFFKTLISFFILSKFHRIYGEALDRGGYELSYVMEGSGMRIFFTKNRRPH